MKKNNLSLTTTINTAKAVLANRAKHSLSMAVIMLLAGLTSACQMTAIGANDSVNYGQYYLSLKSLTNKEILAEEKHLNILIRNKYRQDKILNQGKLILIYSLSTTALNNPYKAKRLLNEHLLVSNNMSKNNLAFTMLLRDQLNIQLHLLEQQRNADKKRKQEYAEHHAVIKQLDHVNQQLMLLKKIDKNINERS